MCNLFTPDRIEWFYKITKVIWTYYVADYIKSCACMEVCRQVVLTLDVSFVILRETKNMQNVAECVCNNLMIHIFLCDNIL